MRLNVSVSVELQAKDCLHGLFIRSHRLFFTSCSNHDNTIAANTLSNHDSTTAAAITECNHNNSVAAKQHMLAAMTAQLQA